MPIMRLPYKLRRFASLSLADKCMFLRALYWLAIARAWLAFVPFRELAGRLSAVDGRVEADPAVLCRIEFAVNAAGANVPWRSDCFPKAIAASKLLQSYGYGYSIHLGVERAGDSELLGHAWLKCGETVVTGAAKLDRYTEVLRL